MPLVVIQTTIPGQKAKPFRITEVIGRVADSAEEAIEAALVHIGGERDTTEEFLTARWHDAGGYWLVSYEPVPEIHSGQRIVLM